VTMKSNIMSNAMYSGNSDVQEKRTVSFLLDFLSDPEAGGSTFVRILLEYTAVHLKFKKYLKHHKEWFSNGNEIHTLAIALTNKNLVTEAKLSVMQISLQYQSFRCSHLQPVSKTNLFCGRAQNRPLSTPYYRPVKQL
jgi:hypothetical protein